MKADKALERIGADFRTVEQENPTEGCKEAAEERGLDASQIVKSLIVETNGEIRHVLLPGDRTLSESKLGSEYRMIPPEKAKAITGFEPGTVHPFSSELKHLVDFRVFRNEEVSHTTGDRTEAVVLDADEFRQALENSDFEVDIRDIAVSKEKDYRSLPGDLDEESSRFVVEKGFTRLYENLYEEYKAHRVLVMLKAFRRHGADPEMPEKILERTETETEIQKTVEKLIETGELPEKEGFDLEKKVGSVIEENPGAVKDYRSGQDSAINFLVGKVMEETRGRADPERTEKMLKERM